jgi:hypothetical protein
MEVTLVFGRDSITKNLGSSATVADLATRTNLSVIGAPVENPRFTIDGDEVSSSTHLNDGDEVIVETRAHSKA